MTGLPGSWLSRRNDTADTVNSTTTSWANRAARNLTFSPRIVSSSANDKQCRFVIQHLPPLPPLTDTGIGIPFPSWRRVAEGREGAACGERHRASATSVTWCGSLLHNHPPPGRSRARRPGETRFVDDSNRGGGHGTGARG